MRFLGLLGLVLLLGCGKPASTPAPPTSSPSPAPSKTAVSEAFPGSFVYTEVEQGHWSLTVSRQGEVSLAWEGGSIRFPLTEEQRAELAGKLARAIPEMTPQDVAQT